MIARILKRKKLAVGVAAAMFLLIAGITLLLPKKYRSDLKVLLKNDRVNAIVSSGDQAEGLYYLDEVGEARLNTEVELMRSPDLLRDVVVRTGLAEKELSLSSSKRIDLAVKRLQKNLAIAPVRRSNLIAVSYVSRDPHMAARVLKALMDQYLDFHLRLHSAPGAAQVFRQIADNFGRERDMAQEKLDDFKRQHSIASLPDEKAMTLQRISDLSKQQSDVEVAITRSRNQSSRLQSFIGSTPAVVEKERRSVPNQMEAEQLSMTLVTLESKRVEAAARYQPTDRVVKDLDEQIRLTRDALAKAKASNAEEVSTERNTLHVAAQSDYMKAETELAGLTRQSTEIVTQLRAQQRKLADLVAETAIYDTLTRSVGRLSELNQIYEKKASDVQASELLDKQRVANVAIVETPTEAFSAISPMRGLILASGLVWAVITGLVTALIFDLIIKKVQSPYDLELALEAPVVGLLQDSNTMPTYSEENALVYRALQRHSQPVWRLL